jgi:hypothetical protein
MTITTRESFIALFTIILAWILIFYPDLSYAGTGGEELQDVYNKTEGLVKGYGAKTICILSFAAAMIAAIRGSIMAFVPALGVSVIAGVGPTMVTSGISALI